MNPMSSNVSLTSNTQIDGITAVVSKLQKVDSSAASALEEARDQRHRHDQHAGDRQVTERSAEIAPALGQRTACKSVCRRPGQHADPRSDEIRPETDAGQTISVVLQIKREQRN